MLRFIKIPLILLVVLSYSVVVFAQPPLNSNKRMKTLKKMKMLEVIEFEDENSTNNFLSKYDLYENKIEKQKEEIDKWQDKLYQALQNEESESKIKDLKQSYMNAFKNMHKLIEEKNTEMGKVLSTKEHAKFLLFEKKFHERLRKEVMKRAGDIIRQNRKGKMQNSK